MSVNSSLQTVDMPLNIQYISTGSLAIVFNLSIIFVLLRNVPLFKKSAFVIGLATGDLLDAIALLGNGITRIQRSYRLLNNDPVHPFECMTGKGMTPIFLMGNQIPGVMFLLIGLERYVAIHYFEWYYVKWSNKMAWKCTLCGYVFCALSLIAAYIVTYLTPASAKITASCGTPYVVGNYYITYNYMVSVVGGSVAMGFTVIAMYLFIKRRNKMVSNANVTISFKNHFKAQLNLTRIMLCIAVLDAGLVVIPSVLLTLTNGLNLFSFQSLATWSLQIICSRSLLNIIIYVLINTEFRGAFFKAFFIRRSHVAHVQVVNNSARMPTTASKQNQTADSKF